MQKHLFWFIFFFSAITSFAQQNVTTFGVQLKPVLPLSFIGATEEIIQDNGVNFTLTPRSGFSFGMVARHGFTKMFSIESGINFTRRNFDLSIQDADFIGDTDIKFVTYDIPVLALLYVQLGEEMFMNAAFGGSISFLPSDWQTTGSYFRHFSYRTEWLIPSMLANVGFEYRTYDKGYFYIGASYHQPFTDFTTTNVGYYRSNINNIDGHDAFASFNLDGSYLTLDLRYFFHEDPIRKSQRKKKK
jgi:hypothetical protein